VTIDTRKVLGTGGKVVKFFVTERILTAITRLFDAVLLYTVYMDPTALGALKAFLLLTPVHLVMSILVLGGIEYLSLRGIDATGLNELAEMANERYERRQWGKCFVCWLLRRRYTIFAIGSWFYLDPEYVTLLLRDRNTGFWTSIRKITLPSVILAMVVWTPICFGAVKGINIIEWIWETL